MAIGVKVMRRPVSDVSYIRATLKGMVLTFKHMFEPKVTMQYPEQRSTDDWTISARWRGTHRMMADEQGRSKCVACGLCPQVCPANCIKLVPGEDEAGNRYPLIYEIDEFRCVFCGYCQEVCPEEAIHVGVHYENAEYSRDRFVYDLERLTAQTHAVSTLWDPTDPRGEVMVTIVFYILAACTVVSAVGCISVKNPIASVMWLVAAMFGLAGIYLLHGAEFIAAIQVLVYAGAIMVLFLFAIMLLNIGTGPVDLRSRPTRLVATAVGAVLLLELAALARYSAGRVAVEADPLRPEALSAPTAAFPGAAQALAGTAERGVVGGIAEPLFTTYLVPFEITSVLLLAAAVGAVVLAKRKI